MCQSYSHTYSDTNAAFVLFIIFSILLCVFKYDMNRNIFVLQVPFQKECRKNDTPIADLEVDFNFTYVYLTNIAQW